MQTLWHFTVGFVRVEVSKEAEDAILLGSGILVKIGNVPTILTANHVLDALPRAGRLGLVLSDKLEKTTIDVSEIDYLSIDQGSDPELGPDIGAVLLSSSIASSLEARKTYYSLDLRKEGMLSSPPGDQEGIWIASGFVEEMTVLHEDPPKYDRAKGFCQFNAVGGVDSYISNGDHDYYTFPLTEPPSQDNPRNFGGCSGGGLWHVLLTKNGGGELSASETLLQGLVYFQQPPCDGSSALRCHGPRSIYGVAYSAFGQGAPKQNDRD